MNHQSRHLKVHSSLFLMECSFGESSVGAAFNVEPRPRPRSSPRTSDFLPLPVRHKRGEGRGEGLVQEYRPCLLAPVHEPLTPLLPLFRARTAPSGPLLRLALCTLASLSLAFFCHPAPSAEPEPLPAP